MNSKWYILTRRKLLWPLLVLVFAICSILDFTGLATLALILIIVELTLWSDEKNRIAERTVSSVYPLPRLISENLYIRRRYEWHPGFLLDTPLPEEALVFNEKEADIKGEVKIPLLESSIEFRYRTDSNGRRICRESDEGFKSKPTIEIFGASATFGTGIWDEETFPWHLQQVMPEYNFLNYGVAGFSAYEIWQHVSNRLKLEKALPKLIVCCLHPALIGRDCGQFPERYWYTSPRCLSYKLPWSEKRSIFHLPPRSWIKRYDQIPIRSLKTLVGGFASNRILPWNQNQVAQQTLQHVLLQIQKTCTNAGVPLIICELSRNSNLSEFLQAHEFSPVCCDIDLNQRKETGGAKWTLEPFDMHPNALAHRQIAAELHDGIEHFFSTGSTKPVKKYSNPSSDGDSVDRFIYPLF